MERQQLLLDYKHSLYLDGNKSFSFLPAVPETIHCVCWHLIYFCMHLTGHHTYFLLYFLMMLCCCSQADLLITMTSTDHLWPCNFNTILVNVGYSTMSRSIRTTWILSLVNVNSIPCFTDPPKHDRATVEFFEPASSGLRDDKEWNDWLDTLCTSKVNARHWPLIKREFQHLILSRLH